MPTYTFSAENFGDATDRPLAPKNFPVGWVDESFIP
jgi:hypothetical protein